MADPGFPTGGANPRGKSANLLFGKSCAENCMENKTFGPPPPLGSATGGILNREERMPLLSNDMSGNITEETNLL